MISLGAEVKGLLYTIRTYVSGIRTTYTSNVLTHTVERLGGVFSFYG